jgi:TPP-dependent pyruvate/acetoin dehydrogenase alpha subunit
MPSRPRTRADTTLHEPLHERLYRSMLRIRRTEEEIARVYPTDVIKSPVHLSIGQEAVAAGVCDTLKREDIVFGSYRGHAMYLAKGGDLPRMIAELYGKVTGCARGKGGSMHLVDVASGVMGTSAVVASTIPNAVGYAYANRLLKRRNVVVSFFGDGATEEGSFYESLNFARLKRLPVVFVCENNGYAIHAPLKQRQPLANIRERAAVFGIQAEHIGGNDVLRIRERVNRAVSALRAGKDGPYFFECVTYRWKEHVGPGEDFGPGFRPKKELGPWLKGDQLGRLARLISKERRAAIEGEVAAEIREAFAYAEKSPFPEAAELLSHVYKGA